MWHPTGVDVEAMMKDLGSRGILDLLVEGGPTLARSLVQANLIDRVVVYLAGRLAGGSGQAMFAGVWRTLGDARPLTIIDVSRVGGDVKIEAVLEPADGKVT